VEPYASASEPPGADARSSGFFEALRYVGDLARRFWLCEAAGGTLVVIDPRAVLERVSLSDLYRRYRTGTLKATSGSLFAATVELSVKDAHAVVARTRGLADIGIRLEPFGAGTVAVKAVPKEVEGGDLSRLFLRLCEVIPADVEDVPESGEMRLAAATAFEALRMLAALGRQTSDRTWTFDEVRTMLAALEHAEVPLEPFRSRVVLHEMHLLDLEAKAFPVGLGRGSIPNDLP
jgi:DNA mismatch repair protein MutL